MSKENENSNIQEGQVTETNPTVEKSAEGNDIAKDETTEVPSDEKSPEPENEETSLPPVSEKNIPEPVAETPVKEKGKSPYHGG